MNAPADIAKLRTLVARQDATIAALTEKNEALLEMALLAACAAHRYARWKRQLPQEAFV